MCKQFSRRKNELNLTSKLPERPVRLRTDYPFSYSIAHINKGINPKKGKVKPHTEFAPLPCGGSIDDFKSIVNKGYAVSPSIYKNNYRNKDNFLYAEMVMIDIDNSIKVEETDEHGNVRKDENGKPIIKSIYLPQLPLEDALKNDYITKHGLIYTSASHQEEWSRYRVIFFLPQRIEDKELLAETIKVIINHIAPDKDYKDLVDSNCIECARMFYGNTNAVWYNDNPLVIDQSIIEQAKENLIVVRKEREEIEKARHIKKVNSYTHSDFKELGENVIEDAINHINPNCDYEKWFKTGLACHSFDPSDNGFKRWDNWSSQGSSYPGTDALYRKWQSFGNNYSGQGVTVGTLFHYAIEEGFRFKSEFIDPEHGKIVASGKDAIARAKSSVTDDELREHQIISLVEFEEMLEQQEFTDYQERVIRKINALTEGKQKGFAERYVTIPLNFSDEIIYDPETFYFISSSDINSDTKLFIPKKHQNPKVYARILTYLNYIGLKHIFLKLQAGQGKSTCVSFLDKVLYIDTNYNNPSNPLIKDFHSLTPRSEHGIYEVKGEVKVDPEKKVRDKADQPDSGVIKLKDGNCELKSVFRAFQSKGYSAEGNKAICDKCKSNKTCSIVSGGFRLETKRDMSIITHSGRGRVHPSQLTVDKINQAFPTFIKVWEEASTLPINSDNLYSELTIRRLRGAIDNIVKDTPDFNPQLAEYLFICLDFLADILDPTKAKLLTEDNRFFGLPHEVITSHLPNLDASIIDGFFDNDIQHLLSILCPDIADLVPNYQNKKDLESKLEEFTSNLDTSPYHLLMALLFGNDSQYCISTAKVEKRGGIEWQLMITEPVTKWGQLAEVGGSNIYLDATATPNQIKAIFDIDDDTPFLTIVNEVNELDNLLVRNINLKGLGSNTWSQDAIARAKRGVELIKAKNPDKQIAVMTLKKYAEEFNTSFWYGKSDRGSNELIGYDGIIFVGSPFPDVGAIKREYVSLYKHRQNKPTFDQFYSQKRYEQRMQGLARLRAQHSKHKQFFQYYLTTNEDLSYLEEIGVKHQTIEGVMLSPDLGSGGDKTLSEISIIAQNFVTSGIDFSLSMIAKAISKTKQAVSQAIKRVCNGFEEFKKCQLNLYNYYIGLVDERIGIQDCWGDQIPDDLITFAVDEIHRNQSEGFLNVVKAFGLPKNLAFRLLWLVSGIFDPRIPESFLTLNEG